MLLLRRVVAGCLTRSGPSTRRMRALLGCAALLGSLGACGGTEPQIPSNVSLTPLTVSFSALGQTQQLFPSVTDQDGKAISGAGVSWTSSNTGVASVSPAGVVTATGGGSATVTATSGSAAAIAQVTVAQTPAQIQKISGDGQTGPAGTTLTAPLVIQVNDAGGNPIAGRSVTFTVDQGDGTVGAASLVTGSDGRASTSFTIGTSSGSPQAVSVSIAATALSVSFTAIAAADPTSFNIGLRYLSSATPAQRQAFTDARLRWQNAITADVQDISLTSNAGQCGSGSPAVNQTIDDVLILIRLIPIDGANGVLGQAGPCYYRGPGDPLAIMGVMQFDTDDLPALESNGELGDVILHEMGHVLGFGTLWNVPGEPALLADPSLPPPPSTSCDTIPGTDPHFTGAQAITAFNSAGGVTYVAGAKVPVEKAGGCGTADAHWRESVLGSELMTGFIDGQNPLSRITIASLDDMGYTVNLAAADGFSFLTALQAFGHRPKRLLKNDILRVPIKKVDRHGRVTGVFRR
jgi:hypothetical protein